LKAEGKNPLQLDSRAPRIPLKDYAYNETRYRMLTQSNPEAAARLLAEAQATVLEHWRRYEQMAAMDFSREEEEEVKEETKPRAVALQA